MLATIGATAPFVGLFGTVWGIMNSFIGISKSQTTNLAVVAPGIAEALLATALGLVAAIPAVVIYNVFARSIAGYRALLGDASAEVMRLVSRDLDRRAPCRRSRRPACCRADACDERSSVMSVRLDHGDDELAEIHEINVTPFIDVMLVLLIIFMVAAPLATVDVPVDLPASTAEPQQRPDKPLFLTVKADLTLALGDDTVPREQLAQRARRGDAGQQGQAHLPARRQGRPLWRRDGGDEFLRTAGYLKVALVGLEKVVRRHDWAQGRRPHRPPPLGDLWRGRRARTWFDRCRDGCVARAGRGHGACRRHRHRVRPGACCTRYRAVGSATRAGGG